MTRKDKIKRVEDFFSTSYKVNFVKALRYYIEKFSKDLTFIYVKEDLNRAEELRKTLIELYYKGKLPTLNIQKKVVKNLERALRIKSNSLRGGIVEDIYLRNIKVEHVSEAALKINHFYSTGRGEYYPTVRNIFVEDLHSYQSKYAIWIKGDKKSTIENIYLVNCSFKNVKKENFIENAQNIVFENVTINDKNQ